MTEYTLTLPGGLKITARWEDIPALFSLRLWSNATALSSEIDIGEDEQLGELISLLQEARDAAKKEEDEQ